MLARKAAGEIEADARAALDQVAAEGVELRLVHGRAGVNDARGYQGRNARCRRVTRETRGRGTLLGSVATRLVHDAPCSVLVTRAADEPKHFPQSIAVGVDGSPASLNAAAAATELGVRLGAKVTIIAATGNPPDIDESVTRTIGTHPRSQRRETCSRIAPSVGECRPARRRQPRPSWTSCPRQRQ